MGTQTSTGEQLFLFILQIATAGSGVAKTSTFWTPKTWPCSIWKVLAGYNFQVEQSDGRDWHTDANSFGAMSRCARAHLFDGVGHWAFRSRWKKHFHFDGVQIGHLSETTFCFLQAVKQSRRWFRKQMVCLFGSISILCFDLVFDFPPNRRSENDQSASNIRWVLSVLRLVRWSSTRSESRNTNWVPLCCALRTSWSHMFIFEIMS